MKKIIIFDLDGTLYQTHVPLLKAVKQAYHDFNLDFPSEKDILNLIGEPSDIFITKLIKQDLKVNIKQLVSKISYYEKKYIYEYGQIYDGVKKTLAELKKNNYDLAICTNGSESYVNSILLKHEIRDFFSIIKSRNKMKNKSELIKNIIKENKSELTIVVGDSDHDIIAAKTNNAISIGCSYGYRSHTINNADYMINDISEILSLAFKLEILHKIEKNIKNKKTNKAYVIGINGVDTSGKTIFSTTLKDYLLKRGYKIQLISIDEFHNHSSIRYSGDNPIDSYIDFGFNLELLKDEILLPLSKGEKVIKELKLLDLDTDEFSYIKSINVDKSTIVILEGVLLYREPINQFFDTRVFIDITFDEVLRRAKIRDVPKYGEAFLQRYITKYIPIQNKYIYKHHPKSNSQIVIDNNDYDKPRIV